MSFLENVVPEKFRVSKEEYDARLKHCNSCHVRKSKTNSCGKLILGSRVYSSEKGRYITTCGCVVTEKAVLKSEHCDLGKW